MSPCFEFVARTYARLLESFRSQIFPLSVVPDKKYMKLNVGNMVDHMTRGSCIPTECVKSGDDCSNLVYNIETEHILIRIRPIWHTWLVKVMICRVSNI